MSTVVSTPAVASNRKELGWIRGATFDYTLIIGVAAVALASGTIVVARPIWFPIVLFLDLWLLGYHHVVSTFTRLSFDKESLARIAFWSSCCPGSS